MGEYNNPAAIRLVFHDPSLAICSFSLEKTIRGKKDNDAHTHTLIWDKSVLSIWSHHSNFADARICKTFSKNRCEAGGCKVTSHKENTIWIVSWGYEASTWKNDKRKKNDNAWKHHLWLISGFLDSPKWVDSWRLPRTKHLWHVRKMKGDGETQRNVKEENTKEARIWINKRWTEKHFERRNFKISPSPQSLQHTNTSATPLLECTASCIEHLSYR